MAWSGPHSGFNHSLIYLREFAVFALNTMKASWALFATSLHGLLGVAAALPQHPAYSTYENGESRPGTSLDRRADEISVAQAVEDFTAALSISGYDMSTFDGNVTNLATRASAIMFF